MTSSNSRFTEVLLLHDQGDGPGGRLDSLVTLIKESHPTVRFTSPVISINGDTAANFNTLAIKILPMLHPNTMVLGDGIGGLFAVALQERFPALNLGVFAINAPVRQDTLSQEWNNLYSLDRVILYSSEFPALRGTPHNWAQYSRNAYDVPWLTGGYQKAMYATAYLISSFMKGLDMGKELSCLPQLPAQSEAASI